LLVLLPILRASKRLGRPRGRRRSAAPVSRHARATALAGGNVRRRSSCRTWLCAGARTMTSAAVRA